MQEWIICLMSDVMVFSGTVRWLSGTVLVLAGIYCRLRYGRTGRSSVIRESKRTVAANAALILTGWGIYLMAGPLWSDTPAVQAGGPADSPFPVSLAATLLVIGVIFSIGILFNRNKPSSC